MATATKRNALVLQLIPIGFFIAGQVVANVLSLIQVGQLAIVAGILLQSFFLLGMVAELKQKANDTELTPWHVFVPCLNLYVLALKVPPVVTKAKQMANVSVPTRSLALYVLLPVYALASDLNDLP